MSYNQSNRSGDRFSRPNPRSRGRGGGGRGGSNNSCYICGQPGHFSRECPSNRGQSRGRGQRGGRGGARGRGGASSNNACFRCGEPGHFSRDCPNNAQQHGGGRGSYRGRGGGGGRGRGRSSYGRSGGGRGGYKGSEPVQKHHEPASDALVKDVEALNEMDEKGPQMVKVCELSNGWQRIESLSQGRTYWHSPSTKQTVSKEPSECRSNDVQVREEFYQEQGSSFAKPPHAALYAGNLEKIPIRTNAFRVSGEFMHNEVHTYQVEFEPPLRTDQVLQRARVIYGKSNKQKRRNQAVLREAFGHWTFDNNHLFSMGVPKKISDDTFELDEDDNYTVKFIWVDSHILCSSDLESTEETKLLSVFCKRGLKNAGFTDVRRAWFYKNVNNPPPELRHIKPTRLSDKVTLLHGFNTTMCLSNEARKQQEKGALFKAEVANKQISTKTVHAIIQDIGLKRDPLSAEFQQEVRRQLVGKFFVMTYNSISRKIYEVDFNQDERNTFERNDGAKISYTQYLQSQYGVKSRLKESCVLMDDRGSAYLPQHAHLTIRSDETDDIKDLLQEYTNPPIEEQLSRVKGLVHVINKNQQDKDDTDKHNNNDDEKKPQNNGHWNDGRKRKDMLKYGLRINERSVLTEAICLSYPKITIMAFGNNEKTTSIHPEEFKWGGREGTKGFLGSVRAIKRWVIVANNIGPIHEVESIYNAYTKMRSFQSHNLPIERPEHMVINFDDQQSYKQLAKGKWQLIFLCLPEGKYGSVVKTRATKALQSQHLVKNSGCLLQCMMTSTIYDRKKSKDSILGALEQAMGKYGNILYKVTPSIPPKSPYYRKLDRIWTIGLDISHGGGAHNKNPSVCILTLQTLPFCGTQRGMRNMCWLNDAKKDVIPYQATVAMTLNALQAEIAALRNEQTRPEIIMIFRDGAPDNALKEIHSKELVGIQRGIYEVRQVLQEQFGIKWKPRIQFIVVSKDPIDRFGEDVNNGQEVRGITYPCVVVKDITSRSIWDFFVWSYHPNTHLQKMKPKRYVVLRDELKIGQCEAGSNAPMGMFEIIYSLAFTYHPSIPFIQGGTSQPAPITFAKHFAEKFAQLITSDDRRVEDLRLAKNLNTQPMIITEAEVISSNASSVASSPKKPLKAKSDTSETIENDKKAGNKAVQMNDDNNTASKAASKSSRRSQRRKKTKQQTNSNM